MLSAPGIGQGPGVYSITIERRALRMLARFSEADAHRITVAIQALAADPRPPGCKKLTGRDAWRIRVGDYRVLYEIADGPHIVAIIDIGHRRDVYR
jgi:mRNA interferase RelE/StbE